MQFWENLSLLKALYSDCTSEVCEKFRLTKMEYDIMMFLTNNPQCDTAADIVKLRRLTKSHVSAALKNLESRGLVTKSYCGKNQKSLHLKLTPEAAAIVSEGREAQIKYAKILFNGFSDKELMEFYGFYERVCQNCRSADLL